MFLQRYNNAMLILHAVQAIESEVKNIAELRLIKKAAAGDEDAFEKLARSYENKIYGYALRLLCDREDVEDALQETLIKLYKNIGKFSQKRSFAAWLMRITRNTCVDILRKRKGVESLEAMSEIGYVLPATKEDFLPEASAERMEQRRILAALIDSLPENKRAVIILRDIDGYTYSQIAQILNTSEGTVKSRLSRARAALRDGLCAEGVFSNFNNTGE